MLSLQLDDLLLQQIAQLAEKEGLSIEDAGRLALRNGLALLLRGLDELIQQHWQDKSDGEIAKLAGVARRTAVSRRRDLGLIKTGGIENRGKLKTKIREIGLELIENELTRKGFKMTEITRKYALPASRERLRQILDELGVKHSPIDRTPEWLVHRRARMAGNMNLANREWLGEQLSASSGISQLAASLSIQERDLEFFVRTFGLTHPSFRQYGTETVDLVCANPRCGKPFRRLRRWVDRRLRNSLDPRHVQFYCSVSCVDHAGGEGRPSLQEHKRRDTFIRKYWKRMPDKAMAEALQVTTSMVARHRLALGFHRDGHGNPILEK